MGVDNRLDSQAEDRGGQNADLKESTPTSQLVILIDHQLHVFGMDCFSSILEHFAEESAGKLVFLSGHPLLVIEAASQVKDGRGHPLQLTFFERQITGIFYNISEILPGD